MDLLQQISSNASKGSCVSQWLMDLRNMTETECMNVLQGKPLLTDTNHKDPSTDVKDIKGNIDALKELADGISGDFAQLFRCFEDSQWEELRQRAVRIAHDVQSLVRTCNSRLKDVPGYVLEQQEVVKGESTKLIGQSASFCDGNAEMTKSSHGDRRIPLINQLTFLGQSFSRLVDVSLGHLVQKIVDSLTSGCGLSVVHAAISCIVELGLEGEHMCFIIAREGGVRGLLDVCRRETLTFTRSQALRALATICCAPECIAELEKERGVELLVDVLCEVTGASGDVMQGEAAGVVAQLTSPCLQHGHHLGGLLHDLHRLLQALLRLCQRTVSHEVFLLSVAAIANITFLHSAACSTLLELGAPHLLVKASSVPKARSLFAKDQVATVLANMAALPACQSCIRQHEGVELLVRFLHERPLALAGKAELAACERVQQKAAIALSRLCRGSSTETVIHTKAIPRLVELCRYGRARNQSDAVLVACLAALRKICSVSGSEGLHPLDLQQLVQPQLMDSFLICSNTDENFV